MFCARLFICALWSTAGKGLTSWLSFVVSYLLLSNMYFNMSFKVTEDREGFIIFYVMKYRKILIKYNAYISQP